jgi:hypothetical protein
MVAPPRLTVGDIWDHDEPHPARRSEVAPADIEPFMRRSRAYIARFAERVPPLRAIRIKCGACMGSDGERMPRGEVARAIDECGSVDCPLWPFRFGTDPWRPGPSAAQRATGREAIAGARAHLGRGQTMSAQNADRAPTGTQAHPAPGALAGAAARRVS